MSERQQAKNKKQSDKQNKRPSPQTDEKQQAQRQEQQSAPVTPVMLRQAVARPEEAKPKTVEAMQRAYGNQFVQRLQRRRQVQRALTVNEPDDQYEKEAEGVAASVAQRSLQADGGGPPDTAVSPQEASSAQPQTGHAAPQKPNPPPGRTAVQRSLTVNEPDDAYEKEAEVVADQLDHTAEHTPPIGGDGGPPPTQRNNAAESAAQADAPTGAVPLGQVIRRAVPTRLSGSLFRQPTAVEAPELPPEADISLSPEIGVEHAPPVGVMDGEGESSADPLQRNTVGYDAANQVDAGVEGEIERKRGGGEALPDPVRDKMEGHLGSDFSGVRVHNDDESDQLNRSLNAEAFTTGSDIFFSRDSYEPGSQGGQKLLAHELTHVVQQGGASPKPVQRDHAPEEEEADVQRETAVESTSASESATWEGTAVHIPGMPQPLMRTITPAVMRSVPQIQREDSEEKKAKREGKKKIAAGEEKANNKKAEKQSKKDEKENKAANQEKKEVGGPKKKKPKGDPKPKVKEPQPIETRDQVNDEEIEAPEPPAMDTGSLGWPPTKNESIPDWDDEIKKYDAFKQGNYDEMGIDLSGLEGDTTGLSEAITVDDPEVRRQMVQDALAGGLGGDGDFIGPQQEALGVITDMIPFAGPLASASKFVTEGPKEWWESTKTGFKNAAANISSAWKGMGEGSGWNRAASAIEFIMGLLEMINNIAQFLILVTTIVLIVLGIIFGVGTVLAAIPFTAGIGASMVSFSSPLIPIAAAILAYTAVAMVYIALIIRILREVAIAFRIIDMLYYESDPDKLMERQAKLAEHITGRNQAAHEMITPGVNKKKKEEQQAEDMLVGAEELEDPMISEFSIERVNTKEDEDKQEYKTDWMKKYGIRSTADDVRDSFMEEEVPPPPLAVYTGERETDVAQKIDRNAVAIVELKKQRLGLTTQQKEIDESYKVAKDSHDSINVAQDSVAEDKRLAGEHQKDIDTKLDKQDDLKAKTTETEKQGEESGGQGLEVKGLAGLILKMLQPLMPAVKKSGEGVDGKKQDAMDKGPDTTLDGTDATVKSAKEGSKEADQRKQDTLKTQKEAQKSDQELEKLDQFLDGKKDEVEEGLSALEEQRTSIEETTTSLEEEEQRLIEERTEALNQAVNWMVEWRERRDEIFSSMEERLEARLPKEEEEEDDEMKAPEEGEEEKDIWDIYDKEADLGETKGKYFHSGMATKSEGSEDEMGFDLGE